MGEGDSGQDRRAEPSRQLIDAIWDAYGLDGTPPTVGALRDLGGGSNLNLLATSRGQRFVVRVYRTSVSPGRLGDLQRIRRLVGKAGVPVAALHPTVDGRPWLEVDGRLVEVEEYIDHDANMDTWPRLRIGMPLLGVMHSALEGVDASEDGRRPVRANAVDAEDALDITARGVRRIRSWGSSVGDEVLRMTFELEEVARRVADAEQTAPPTAGQLVHGDFWDNNVLFRAGRPVVVTDFDFAGHRPRVDDLALTLFFADLTLEPPQDERMALLRGLVDAYDSGLDRALSPAERAGIPAALARQQLWALGHVAHLDDGSARSLAEVLVGEVRRTLPIARNLDRWREALM